MSAEKLLYRTDTLHGGLSSASAADLHFSWQTGGSASLLATTGADGSVAVLNRAGQLQQRLVHPGGGLCAGFAWDLDGDLLAIISTGSAQVLLWDANTQQSQTVDVGLRDPLTCVVWSRSAAPAAQAATVGGSVPAGLAGPSLLAVGSARGNVSVYNHQTMRRTPILGKHSRRITCAAWSSGAHQVLALAGDDKTLSLSTADGDTLRVVALRDTPADMHFAAMKTDTTQDDSSSALGTTGSRGGGGDNTVSVILGRRTLYLYHLPDPDSPTELGFQSKYGALVQHQWFGDGYVLLGFAGGYAVAISTHAREVGQELWQVRNHRDQLSAVAVAPVALGLLASGGIDGTVKLHSTANLKETVSIVTLPAAAAAVRQVTWSTDGQLLAISTQQGGLFVYVCQLAALCAVSAPRLAVLSSLAEVTLYADVTASNSSSNRGARQSAAAHIVALEIEPTFLALGPRHMACGMNNHVWFYELGAVPGDIPALLGDREYLSEISEVRLNGAWAAVLYGGQVMLHPITGTGTGTRQPQVFPGCVQGMHESIITCMVLVGDFLAFSTDLGNVVFFALSSWLTVIRWRHSMGIKRMFSDSEVTKLVLIDDHNDGHVFLPATEDLVRIADFPKNCTAVLWDTAQSNLFVGVDERECRTFVFVKHSVEGRHVCRIEPATEMLIDKRAVHLSDGDLLLTANGGKLATIRLATHSVSITGTASAGKSSEHDDQLATLLKLRRHADAWALCRMLNNTDAWQRLGRAALADLDVALAQRAFRQCSDTGAAMVFALNEVQHIEDASYIAGTCAMLLDQPDRAKSFYARSIRPLAALELCCDLLQWEQAMSLAETLDATRLPEIAREYAQQLEFGGQHAEALLQYERGLSGTVDDDAAPHRRQCQVGIARTTIKTGDHKRGIRLALELASAAAPDAIDSAELLTDCADALVELHQPAEAAALLERAGAWDRACLLYADQSDWARVGALLPRVAAPRLHAVYAAAMDAVGDYASAVRAYTAAGDMDGAVRVHLERLADPHAAGEIVLGTRSAVGARQLARFYQQIGDTEQALQFLVMCGCVPEALALARRHNQMPRYAELLDACGTDATTVRPADYRTVAEHFEAERHSLLAGKYYGRAGEPARALRLLVRAASAALAGSAEEAAAVQLAIDCVAASHDDRLAGELIAVLLGDGPEGGAPREPRYLFRLYMARGQFREAAKTAVIVGQQEQRAGNYRAAHALLFGMCQELKRNGMAVGAEMRAQLRLLHRYALVRVHVKLGDHRRAARLLCVVAASIGQFPQHIVPILTSTVVECHRAGMASDAYQHAVTLMRPEYRAQVDAKYAKKIEAIVRRAPRAIKGHSAGSDGNGGLADASADSASAALPCPVCDSRLAGMETVCHQCRTTLPVCIATGEHIACSDLAACPECDFPCFRAAMTRILDLTNQCPMCGEIVDSNRLSEILDVATYMNSIV